MEVVRLPGTVCQQDSLYSGEEDLENFNSTIILLIGLLLGVLKRFGVVFFCPEVLLLFSIPLYVQDGLISLNEDNFFHLKKKRERENNVPGGSL